MTLGERIAAVCKETAGMTAKDAWGFACANGWGNPHGAGGGAGWLAWCCVGASWRVFLASEGRVTLAFGRGPKRSRFRTGNASVPQLWADAKDLGLISTDPRPGMLCLVSVRHKDKAGVLPPWSGVPCHIGIVTDLARKNGVVVGVVSQEGNYGGHDATVHRPMKPGASAKERVLCFVDMEKYADTLVMGEIPDATDPHVACFDDGDPTCESLFPLGRDVLASAFGETRTCRVVDRVDDVPVLQPLADDGQVQMDATLWQPGDYVILGDA